ncbi:MAG: pyridoxal phosphate-dependent aminotransferase, partial [Pseudomonadota bacterium]
MSFTPHLSTAARDLPESGVVAVMNFGRTKENVVPLWVGEGDLPTPDFISQAANKGLADGETFYTWQRGIPELRQALANYHQRLYKKPMQPDRFFVTGSGMQAIMLAVQAVAGPGDEVIVPAPYWPNIHAAVSINRSTPVVVEMDFDPVAGWSLDLEKIERSITPNTKAMFLNTPSNPTGWVADRETLQALLELARKNGLWILADEVYARFVYDRDAAPSFYDVIEPDDRLIFVNTFSKNWAMTGWRVGWISAPPELGQVFENLVQYNTSGVAAFLQRGAVTALAEGEGFFQMQLDRARKGRDILSDALSQSGCASFAKPDGTFYLFFHIDGEDDATDLAYRLVDE